MQTIVENINRRQDLGQYFTPYEVVALAYNFLNVLLNNEKDKWIIHNGKQKYPSVIDPACGEGIFLKTALEKQITLPKYVFGVDIDEHVVALWEKINLLKTFGSEAELQNHFFHQNGLLPLNLDPQKYPYLKSEYSKNELFDLVVGNPPFGGTGVEFEEKLTAQNIYLIETLQQYEFVAWRANQIKNNGAAYKKKKLIKKPANAFSPTLFEPVMEYEPQVRVDASVTMHVAKSLPIEILFIERFVKLCKPGGHIAIILPDGVLSNATLTYVRDWIHKKCILHAIISLPRDTFKHAKTSAKTSLLILTKRKSNLLPKQEYVFMASVKKFSSLTNETIKIITNCFSEALENKQ
jgi:type I restriction enzyme M protein